LVRDGRILGEVDGVKRPICGAGVTDAGLPFDDSVATTGSGPNTGVKAPG
jgi:hypothetical protein